MFGLLQLELPFFKSLGTPSPPSAAPSSASSPVPDQAKPRRGTRKVQPTAPPDEPRLIALDAQVVHYTIRRSVKRRTLGLTIDMRGLRVAAPLRAKQGDIERLILANAQWVQAKLKEWQRPAHLPARGWMPTDPMPWFGTPLPLHVAPGRSALACFDDRLILTVPAPEAEAGVRKHLREHLKARAREHFSLRLAHFCAQFGVDMPALRLSQAATRWGSCARDREGRHRVSLNWRMLHFAPPLIDYVIAHEVAHIKHMHHGPRFWAAVGRLYPGYEAARDEIKRRALELPEI